MQQQPRDVAIQIAKVLSDKKAQDIMMLEVGHLTVVADYFIIASGRASTQVKALCDEIEDKMDQMGIQSRRREGYAAARWVVLDYASVIVHIFHEQEREYYNLERLWMDGSNQIDLSAYIDEE